MKQALSFPVRLLFFWLFFFAAFRLWFVLWFWSASGTSSTWRAFWHALPLDLSMAGYLMAVPVLLWFGSAGAYRSVQRASVSPLMRGFNFCLITVLVFVFGANVFLYEEWHTPLNHRALQYMATPKALLDSMSWGFQLVAIVLYMAGTWLFWRLYRYIVERGRVEVMPDKSPFSFATLAILPFWLLALVFLIRGGLRTMPVNESAVYYSPHTFDNHAAINTAWHLAHSQMEVRATTNHFRFMPDEKARQQVDFLMGKGILDGGRLDLFQPSPAPVPFNVVILMLESHSAQVVEELGGEPGVCPNLSRLIGQGILFDSCYSSGYRTDQGLVSVLAGYPAQPDQSIVLQSEKAAQLGSLSKSFRQKGYSTAFLYGGELTFANIGVWLSEQQFDRILSEKDFSKADKTQRWGVDDHRLLQHTLTEINRMKPPFFATALTLSLHPPYDVPYQSRWSGGSDIRSKFLHSAAFTDWAIGEFFRAAAQQPWYANTLFVLVADHGTASIGETSQDDPLARHIPLIFFSPRLSEGWVGKRVPVYCGHHDIPCTLLNMLYPDDLSEIGTAYYPWSRDLWWWYGNKLFSNKYSGFGYYTNENGLGWVNASGKGFYSFADQRWRMWQGQLDSTHQVQARAYLQVLYEDFLSK